MIRTNSQRILMLLVTQALILVGCGHNRFNETKTFGATASFPLGELGSLSFGIGSIESTVAMFRGGSAFNTQTIAGEGLLAAAGGTAKVTTFRSNMQINEGNLLEVMIAPTVPQSAKLELAKSLAHGIQSPDFKESAMHIREAALYSNGYTNQLAHPFQTTGLDKVVEDVTDTAAHIIDTTSATTVHVVDSITDVISNTSSVVDSTVNTISDHLNPGKKISSVISNLGETFTGSVTKWIIVVGASLFGIVLLISLGKKRSGRKEVRNSINDLNLNDNDPPTMVGSAPKPKTGSDEHTDDDKLDLSAEYKTVKQAKRTEDQKTKHCILDYVYYAFNGVFELLHSIIFFWKDMDAETRNAAIDLGKRVARASKSDNKSAK